MIDDYHVLDRNGHRPLAHGRRVSAMDEMLSALAHEGRGALQVMQASLELLKLEIKLEIGEHRGARDYLGRIQDAQQRLRKLFNDLGNDFADWSLDLQRCDLGCITRQVFCELVTVHRNRKLFLHESGDSARLVCQADPSRLHQVLRNLMENSIAACHDPVVIHVDWSEAGIDDQPALRLSLRDNGPGLSLTQLDRAFEPYYTTKSDGTGLGLAIVKRIIELHGGEIALNRGCLNSSRRGAEFVIILPRDQATASAEPETVE